MLVAAASSTVFRSVAQAAASLTGPGLNPWNTQVEKKQSEDEHSSLFQQTSAVSALLPLLFAVFMAAVPAYGNRYWLLFGFLFLVSTSPGQVLTDTLQGSTSGTRSGGTFVAGGWRVDNEYDSIFWHVPTLAHGAFWLILERVHP